MADARYQIPETTIYRSVSDELVVIQLETGRFYYFTAETKGFLDSFKAPRSLDTLLGAADGGSGEDREYIREFCDFLLRNRILEETSLPADGDDAAVPAVRPQFLREGEKTLDELTFLCP